MFGIKDLENLKNLATILVIPFFSAAYVSDVAMGTIRDPMLNDWLSNHDSATAIAVGWGFWFFIVVLKATIVLLIFDRCVDWLHERFKYVMPWFGFVCLTAGIFVLSLAMPDIPKSPLNPLWHLALLCYGFTLIDRAAMLASLDGEQPKSAR